MVLYRALQCELELIIMIDISADNFGVVGPTQRAGRVDYFAGGITSGASVVGEDAVFFDILSFIIG